MRIGIVNKKAKRRKREYFDVSLFIKTLFRIATKCKHKLRCS